MRALYLAAVYVYHQLVVSRLYHNMLCTVTIGIQRGDIRYRWRGWNSSLCSAMALPMSPVFLERLPSLKVR